MCMYAKLVVGFIFLSVSLCLSRSLYICMRIDIYIYTYTDIYISTCTYMYVNIDRGPCTQHLQLAVVLTHVI